MIKTINHNPNIVKIKFKEGNIVRITETWVHPSKGEKRSIRHCVLVNITQKDIKKGFNADKIGLHLLSGFSHEVEHEKANRIDQKHYKKNEGDLKFYTSKWRKNRLELIYEDANEVPGAVDGFDRVAQARAVFVSVRAVCTEARS